MTRAWEEPSLTHNLGVLGTLAVKPVGTKLKFDSETGKFDIEDRRLITRTFSSDSVKSDSHFAAPMSGLLRAAQERVGTGAVTQKAFDDALAGLLRLRTTYSGTAAKVQALDGVLKAVGGLVPMARESTGKGETVVRLRTTYLHNLVYAVRQRTYLEPGQADVCHAFVIDWGRRLLESKPSYGDSRKREGAYTPAATLSRAEHVRMQKKMERVSALQAEEKVRVDKGERPRRSFPGHAKFGHVAMTGADTMQVGEFVRTATGQDVFRAIIAAGRKFVSSTGELVLMVRLDGASAGGSHMLGLHLYGEGLRNVHLFDANVGELRFMSGAEEYLWRFCDDLMTSLYTEGKALLFDSWVVTRLYRVA
jgi:hypothetical protein